MEFDVRIYHDKCKSSQMKNMGKIRTFRYSLFILCWLFFFQNGTGQRSINVNSLPVIKKRCRPIEKQDPLESRRLWKKVTDALAAENIEKATQEKAFLEENQRREEKRLKASNTSFPNKVSYFIPNITNRTETYRIQRIQKDTVTEKETENYDQWKNRNKLRNRLNQTGNFCSM